MKSITFYLNENDLTTNTFIVDEEEFDFSDLDDGIGIDIEANIDFEEDEELEEAGRFIRTQKMKDSAKIVSMTTNQLFGPNGTNKGIVSKLFKLFKKQLKANAKAEGIAIGKVKNWELKLRVYGNPDVGKTTTGKKVGS